MRPLQFNVCCLHESPTLHWESWEVGGGAYDFSQKAFSRLGTPQGEHPINPSVFVQRQIGSFECQWTRRLFGKLLQHMHESLSLTHTLRHYGVFSWQPLGQKKEIIDSCLEYKICTFK